MRLKYTLSNEELQRAIDNAVEHYLRLRAKSNSVDHSTRDVAHDHITALLACQHVRAKMVINMEDS